MKRRYIPVGLCAFAAALLLCAYALYAVCFFRARTPLERAAANLRPEHKMALIDTGERQYLIRQTYLGCYERELKWINSLALIERLPPAACSDADAATLSWTPSGATAVTSRTSATRWMAW